MAWLFIRTCLVGGIEWIAIRTLGAAMPFVFDVLFGAAIGVVGLLVTRLLTVEDLKSGLGWLKRKVGRSEDPEDEQLHA